MAHNDMQIVICKILTYLYECLKAGMIPIKHLERQRGKILL